MRDAKKKVNPAEKLGKAEKEKYYVFTKMEAVKKAMIISLILGAVLFAAGLIFKIGYLMLSGAVVITLFVVLAFIHAYIKSVWNKLLRDERKAKQK